MTFLIISNTPPDTRWVSNIIKESDLGSTDFCSSTSDAIQLLASGRYDFVICEAFLPVLTGLDLKKLMDSFSYNIPVILFSEKMNSSFKVEAKYAGITSCIEVDNIEKELPLIIEEALSIKA